MDGPWNFSGKTKIFSFYFIKSYNIRECEFSQSMFKLVPWKLPYNFEAMSY